MSTKQASLNVLTAKVRSVRPWRSRFNLVSQCLTTFHMWWSGFQPLHGNISWGPISILESAQIFWSHVAYQQYHGSSYTVMSRTPKWGRDWATGAISTSGCRIQGVSKVVRPCERRRNSRVWWSSNGEWQTNTCEFCSGIFQGIAMKHFSG